MVTSYLKRGEKPARVFLMADAFMHLFCVCLMVSLGTVIIPN